MASMGLWKARLRIAQIKHNQDSEGRVTTKSLPRNPKERSSKQQKIIKKNAAAKMKPRDPLAMRSDSGQHIQMKAPEPVKSIEQKTSEEFVRFGEGIVPEEELNKQRVRRHPNRSYNQWVVLLNKDLEQYHRNLAEKKAAKLSCQKTFRSVLRNQIEENNRKCALANQIRQEEAEQILREIQEKEHDELQKQQMKKQMVEKNCLFIQEQLKIRREANERAEQNRQRLDVLAKNTLQKKIDHEKQLTKEMRRRIRINLEQNCKENERQMNEKAKMIELERQRDIEEQLRNIAQMEAAEQEKQNRVKKLADKAAALEKESKIIAKIKQQKQEEEEKRIKKYQEECDEKEKRKEMEKKKAQLALIEDMKRSIKVQLEERKRIRLEQAEEAKQLALWGRELAAQEMARLQIEEQKSEQRRRKYKAELDRQIQLRDDINHADYDGMNENELSINRSLLEE